MTSTSGNEDERSESQEEALEESEQRNPDLHGQAREVEEGGEEGEARTPGA